MLEVKLYSKKTCDTQRLELFEEDPSGHTSECRREKRQRILFAAVAKAIHKLQRQLGQRISLITNIPCCCFPYTPESRSENMLSLLWLSKHYTEEMDVYQSLDIYKAMKTLCFCSQLFKCSENFKCRTISNICIS